jgi:hypothetical protein
MAVRTNLPRIEDYIAAELEIPVNGAVESISGLKVVDVEKVQVPDPQSFSDDDRVTITAKLLLRIAAKVRRYSSVFAPRQVLKVGEEAKAEITYRSISTSTLAEEELVKAVNVELKATYREEHFVELEPMSVSLSNEAFYGGFLDSLPGLYS